MTLLSDVNICYRNNIQLDHLLPLLKSLLFEYKKHVQDTSGDRKDAKTQRENEITKITEKQEELIKVH